MVLAISEQALWLPDKELDRSVTAVFIECS